MMKYFIVLLTWVLAQEKQTLNPILEFSFGQTLVYASEKERANLVENHDMVIPTGSFLLLGEYLISKDWGLMAFANLPLSPDQKLVDGEIVMSKANQYYGIGPRYSPFKWNIMDRFSLQPQLAVFSTWVAQDWNQYKHTLILAHRYHISTSKGNTMYFGAAYTFGVKAITLMYGMGHRF